MAVAAAEASGDGAEDWTDFAASACAFLLSSLVMRHSRILPSLPLLLLPTLLLLMLAITLRVLTVWLPLPLLLPLGLVLVPGGLPGGGWLSFSSLLFP